MIVYVAYLHKTNFSDLLAETFSNILTQKNLLPLFSKGPSDTRSKDPARKYFVGHQKEPISCD